MKIFKSKITYVICAVLLIGIICTCIGSVTKKSIKTVGSYSKLNSIYEYEEDAINQVFFATLFPFNLFSMSNIYKPYQPSYSISGGNFWSTSSQWYDTSGGISGIDSSTSGIKHSNTSDGASLKPNEDYSTTNLQVEEVDEADIIKTDGEYIYSLSDYDVIITDVRNPEDTKIVSKIESTSSYVVPLEIILNDNKLIIISKDTNNRYKPSTQVMVYDITDKKNPAKQKQFYVDQEYYTSRVVNGNLYIIASGSLRKNSSYDIIDYYTEDNKKEKIGYKNMYYFNDNVSNYETIIASYNLNNQSEGFDVKAYLMDVDNIYVSEKNIYIENEEYKYVDSLGRTISKIFGLKGIYALNDDHDNYEKMATIYKFSIDKNGKVKYSARTQASGRAVDQFSFDEYNSNLRVALQDEKGSRIVVFDDKLEMIGQTDPVEENENMYSSRFVGDKAYLVTYRTIDPLFVFDLSDPKNPKVLGELKIPGYSTYLHPYDENHIIGIGMQTKESIARDSKGNATVTSAVIIGMKMALFDVSDVNNPKQISEVTIGDSSTKSAILNNHKALLFSKERELIAIPVTSYKTDVTSEEYYTDPDMEKLTKGYMDSLNQSYISEGYLVYNINIEDGIKLKGVITHDVQNTYNYSGNLLRGLYIKDNLFTLSQSMLKVNRLDTLEQINVMNIKEAKYE